MVYQQSTPNLTYLTYWFQVLGCLDSPTPSCPFSPHRSPCGCQTNQLVRSPKHRACTSPCHILAASTRPTPLLPNLCLPCEVPTSSNNSPSPLWIQSALSILHLLNHMPASSTRSLPPLLTPTPWPRPCLAPWGPSLLSHSGSPDWNFRWTLIRGKDRRFWGGRHLGVERWMKWLREIDGSAKINRA